MSSMMSRFAFRMFNNGRVKVKVIGNTLYYYISCPLYIFWTFYRMLVSALKLMEGLWRFEKTWYNVKYQ